MFPPACFFNVFSLFWVPFWRHLGLLWSCFWSLCRLFGVLGSSLYVPLACLGCLWALAATFYSAGGSSGLSLGSGTAPGPLFWLIFSCFVTLERGRGRAAGEAEDHTNCKNRGRGLFCWFLSYLGIAWGLVGQCFCKVCLLNALPVPMLRQVFFLGVFL